MRDLACLNASGRDPVEREKSKIPTVGKSQSEVPEKAEVSRTKSKRIHFRK